jgi:hypothetical protein
VTVQGGRVEWLQHDEAATSTGVDQELPVIGSDKPLRANDEVLAAEGDGCLNGRRIGWVDGEQGWLRMFKALLQAELYTISTRATQHTKVMAHACQQGRSGRPRRRAALARRTAGISPKIPNKMVKTTTGHTVGLACVDYCKYPAIPYPDGAGLPEGTLPQMHALARVVPAAGELSGGAACPASVACTPSMAESAAGNSCSLMS